MHGLCLWARKLKMHEKPAQNYNMFILGASFGVYQTQKNGIIRMLAEIRWKLLDICWKLTVFFRRKNRRWWRIWTTRTNTFRLKLKRIADACRFKKCSFWVNFREDAEVQDKYLSHFTSVNDVGSEVTCTFKNCIHWLICLFVCTSTQPPSSSLSIHLQYF